MFSLNLFFFQILNLTASIPVESNAFSKSIKCYYIPLIYVYVIKVHRTIILPVIFYGCETCSLILREEHRLRVFENRVLRRIFGPEWDKLKREWRKLHNDDVNDLYSSPNIIWVIKSGRMGLTGHVGRIGESRGVYRILVVKPEGKRPLGRQRHRWDDNIKMDLQEVGWGTWIDLAQNRNRWWAVAKVVMNLRVA